MNQLFAVEAEDLLLEGRVIEALELCKNGIEEYPEYPAAYSIMIRCFISLGKIREAEQSIHYAKDIFRGNKIFDKLIIELGNYQIPEDDFGDGEETPILPNENNSKHYSYFKHTPKPEEHSIQSEEIPYAGSEDISLDDIASNDEWLYDKSTLIDFNTSEDYQKELQFVQNEQIDIEQSHINENAGFLQKIHHFSKFQRTEPYIISSNIGLIPGIEFPGLLNEPDLSKGRGFDFASSIKGLEDISISSGSSINIDEMLPPLGKVENDEFSLLAIRLDGVKIGKADNFENYEDVSEDYDSQDNAITETIASIYEKQGAYEQALDAYTILLELHPEKKDIYLPIINEIKEKLNS